MKTTRRPSLPRPEQGGYTTLVRRARRDRRRREDAERRDNAETGRRIYDWERDGR